MNFAYTNLSRRLMMSLQLEMYQQQNQNQPQQQSTTVVHTTAAAQPVFYAVPSPPLVCEHYDSKQSKVAGIILIIAGALSILFNIIGMVMLELMTYNGHGFWCGIMVSSCDVIRRLLLAQNC